jgi:hypothetical protein
MVPRRRDKVNDQDPSDDDPHGIPSSRDSVPNGRVIHDAQALRQMAATIAALAGWDLNDFFLDNTPEEQPFQVPRQDPQNGLVTGSGSGPSLGLHCAKHKGWLRARVRRSVAQIPRLVLIGLDEKRNRRFAFGPGHRSAWKESV